MGKRDSDQARGVKASSTEFSNYDQVDKPGYHLAEAADGPEAFDESFEFTTCDLGLYLRGNEQERAAFVDDLGSAMASIGFVVLTGHGIDFDLMEDVAKAVEKFFTSLPLDAKLAFRAARHGAVSEGYFPVKATSEIHPDLVEGWVFGNRAFNLDEDPLFENIALWPQPEFEKRFRELVRAESELFLPIMQSILKYLGSDPHAFDERLSKPNFALRLNRYPPLARIIHEHADQTPRTTGTAGLLVPAGTLQILA
ncbi:MAG: isopenicillin N synthase-like dioxygenase, partial [Planctomycetota bacterium]